MKKIILVPILLFIFSCEEAVILDTQQVDPKLIIEAHLTSENEHQKVVLSSSVDFYFDEQPPVVLGADVVIYDETEGKSYNFEYADVENNGNGAYFSNVTFAGQVGHTYTLNVTVGDDTYTASETMVAVLTIDTLTYRINQEEMLDPEKPNYFYEVLLFAQEPQGTEDYYLFKFFRNDSLIYGSGTDIYVTDDTFLGSEISNFPTPIFYSKNDKAKVLVFSLTREAFIFYNDLISNLNNDSGMFSPPPANPRSNISSGGLGYFIVSEVSSKEILIE